MHLGAALGVSVTAMFGPTDERATRPDRAIAHVVLDARRVVPAVHASRMPARPTGACAASQSSRRARGRAADLVTIRLRRLSRSRRHDHRRGRLLDRPERVAAVSLERRRDPRASTAPGSASWSRPTSRASPADSSPRRSSTRSTAQLTKRARGRRGAHRRVLLLSAPPATGSVAEYARACDCRKPGAGWSTARRASSASIRGGRSPSATAGWMSALARAVGRAGHAGPDRVRASSEERRAAGGSRPPTRSSTIWSRPSAGSY